MKLRNSIVALFVGSMLAVGGAFASDAKVEAKAANCCAKAAKDGKACAHECCIKAAKEGNNCTTCGGVGKAEVHKAEAKK